MKFISPSALMMALLALAIPSSLDAQQADPDAQQASAETAEETSAPIEDQIQGKWVQYRETPNGKYMTIKDHNGKQTILTTYDPSGTAVYAHRSDYVVDSSGRTCIFTYRNRTAVLGPNAGAVDKREVSYLFRLEGDQFLEVHGMMKGDKGKPSLTVWDRLHVDPRPKTGT